MPANHLEELVAEWYEHKGYFLRRNVKVERRQRGGYETELDIVAFHPEMKHLVHLEPSLDADSWTVRDRRFQKKFDLGRKHIPDLFKGIEVPQEIEQIAIFVFASKGVHKTVGGGRVMLIDELLAAIFDGLKEVSIYKHFIDEQKPLLRTLQYVVEYQTAVFGVLAR